ncbi:MAG: hypothetical protein WA055_00265 [Candidatus Moraniibacteriota bacterium]
MMPELRVVEGRLNEIVLSLAEKKYDKESYSVLIDELTFRTFQKGAILAGNRDAKIEQDHFINNPPPVFAQI